MRDGEWSFLSQRTMIASAACKIIVGIMGVIHERRYGVPDADSYISDLP